jgi:hypothetical protein
MAKGRGNGTTVRGRGLAMRARLFLVPALAFAPLRARAYDFLTQEQAQALLFPKARLTPAQFVMTDAQVVALQRAAEGAPIWHRTVKVWKVSTGGWFFIDQVLGREDRITYALGLDSAGKVTGIEILVCDGGYTQVREPAWLAHFAGARLGDGSLSTQVPIISGVTLSSEHVIEGVRRLLAVHALFLAQR